MTATRTDICSDIFRTDESAPKARFSDVAGDFECDPNGATSYDVAIMGAIATVVACALAFVLGWQIALVALTAFAVKVVIKRAEAKREGIQPPALWDGRL